VKLVDGKSHPVISHETGKAMLRPAGLGPEFFIQKGLEDRQIMEQLMQSSEPGD